MSPTVNPTLAVSLKQLALELDGSLQWDDLNRTLYSTDASVYQETPLAVAFPRTEDDVRRLILFAREHHTSLIPRTAGTSLAGQVVGRGIVVDMSRHFTEILEIDPLAGWARVQPGVIRNELNMALQPHGLLFGPETSTQNRAMIGGMLGNNSCGAGSLVYGSTREHVLEIRGFLSDGSYAVLGELTDQQFAEKCDGDDRKLETQIYRQTRELLSNQDVRDEIKRQFPKPEISRRNTGYAIDLLMDASPLAPTDQTGEQTSDKTSKQPFDFCKLIAGSEGTLFFATEIRVRCVRLPPPAQVLLCPHFDSLDQSLRATLVAVRDSIYACELMDHFVLQGAARNLNQRENMAFVKGEPKAILAIQFQADTQDEAIAQAERLAGELQQQSLGYHFPVLCGTDCNRVWDLRKAGLGIVSNVPGDAKPCAVIEDTAVAVDDLPEYIAQFNALLAKKYGIECVHYAHAGAGEIHLRPVVNLKTHPGNAQFRQIAEDIAALVKQFRGSLSGEHGDGRLRGEFLQRMIGDKNYETVKQIKRLWDPDNVFNPNKIVDAPPMNQSLRYEPGQTTPEIDTVFDFSEAQGIVRAAEMCNGSGDCRKTHLSGGTMCPSYMATRAEGDCTRGRANVLRRALSHSPDPAKAMDNDDAMRVLDLCLSCKACKRECPSNVDMAKLKAEFLQGYHDANGVPLATRLIAGVDTSNRLASWAPWLYNAMIANGVSRRMIQSLVGFTDKRSLPRLHRQTLARWMSKRQRPSSRSQPQQANGRAILFCDEFTNYYDTPVGIAAVELMERLGFAVHTVKHRQSGRAAISKGMLRKAKQLAEYNIQSLVDHVSDDVPLVGLEPSALLCFRDEYPQLVSPKLRDAARAISENALLFDEWFAMQIDNGNVRPDQFTDEPRTVRLHGHCHQKAIASLAPSVRMLGLPTNYRVRLIPSGCCGMAGSFGYERDHYQVSMQIGELVLFPTIRNEPPDSLIAAAGTSCRQQITDGTQRSALHPVQIMRDALK